MTSNVAVRVRNVSHQFGETGDERYVRALLDTSLDVARGELLCLIGPSGCGKSTLLNVMGGLLTPWSPARLRFRADLCAVSPLPQGRSLSCSRRTPCFPGAR